MVSMSDFGVSFLNTTAVKMCEKVTSVREVVGKKLGIGDWADGPLFEERRVGHPARSG